MTKRSIGEWLRDRLVPTLTSGDSGPDKPTPEWPATITSTNEVLELAYQALQEEMESEDERIKVVEAKLMNISSLAPIAMTILVAMITVLTSGKVQTFTRTSVWIVAVFGAYITLQFLLAVAAAIDGLSRRSFRRVSLDDWFPQANENRGDYLLRVCKELTSVIVSNRDVINQKVSQLALCHESILNAVWGLLIMLVVLVIITLAQSAG